MDKQKGWRPLPFASNLFALSLSYFHLPSGNINLLNNMLTHILAFVKR